MVPGVLVCYVFFFYKPDLVKTKTRQPVHSQSDDSPLGSPRPVT